MQTRVLAGVLAGAAALVLVPVAGGAPTSSSPPRIKGVPEYDGLLTCQPGDWSGDAKSFDYEWLYTGGGPTIATGRKYRVDASIVNYDIFCRVTAKDAAGDPASADSASVRPGAARTKIVLKGKKVQRRKLTFTGRIGPKGVVKGASIPLYRVLGKDHLLQLFGKTTLKANGKFKIVAPDDPGKHRYKLNLNPESPGLYQFNHAFITVRLKKH